MASWEERELRTVAPLAAEVELIRIRLNRSIAGPHRPGEKLRSSSLNEAFAARVAEERRASYDPPFSLKTRRNLECPQKPTALIRDLARVSQSRHGALLRRLASIAGGSAIRSRASKRVTLEKLCYERAY